jgi:hypothetical protein
VVPASISPSSLRIFRASGSPNQADRVAAYAAIGRRAESRRGLAVQPCRNHRTSCGCVKRLIVRSLGWRGATTGFLLTIAADATRRLFVARLQA